MEFSAAGAILAAGKSQKFADCHRLLAQNYALLATVEEEFLARAIARGKNKVP